MFCGQSQKLLSLSNLDILGWHWGGNVPVGLVFMSEGILYTFYPRTCMHLFSLQRWFFLFCFVYLNYW